MTRAQIIQHIEANISASNYNELKFELFDKVRPYLKTANIYLRNEGDHCPILLVDHVTNTGGLAAIVSAEGFSCILDSLNEGNQDDKDHAELINFNSIPIEKLI